MQQASLIRAWLSFFSLALLPFGIWAQTPFPDFSIQLDGLKEQGIQKCSPQLGRSLLSGSLDPNRLPHYTVVVSDIPGFRQLLNSFLEPPEVLRQNNASNILVLKLSSLEQMARLLSSDLLLFADQADRTPREELIIKDFDPSVNQVNLAQVQFPELTGKGLKVSVKEYRYDADDIDFESRIISSPVQSQLVTAHASTMATIIAGAGHSSKDARGVAPEAQLSSSSFLNLLPDEDAYFTEDQIWVQNHSYGVDIENYYGAEALAYDEAVVRYPQLLHVFSSGNQGEAASTSGLYRDLPGRANLTGNFKMAKNILTVGAIDSFGIVSALSSKGPAYDGRIKPELVAMGQRGSSESAAVVSGAALLLQQRYAELNEGLLPSASLVKAILINSAADVGTPGPDFTSGYGKLRLYQALKTVAEKCFRFGRVQKNESGEMVISVAPGTKQLKLTLCWTDPAAPPNASTALSNDLDLSIEAPDGTVYLPWVLHPFPHPDSLSQSAVRKPDHLNNVEQISIDDPDPGEYTIRIYGYDLQTPAQDFDLSYQTEPRQFFLWTNPSDGETIEANKECLIRWDHNFSTAEGQLEYSLDEGEQWMIIDPRVDLMANGYRWLAPNVFSKIQFRMTIGDKFFESAPFTLSAKTRVAVEFDCSEKLLLRWDPVPQARQYRLYYYENGRMQLLDSTDQVSYIVDKSIAPAQHFAVSPINDGFVEGFRSDAIDYTLQGSFCYIKNFFAQAQADRASLMLSLSSVYQLKQVTFEKEINGLFKEIHRIDRPDQLDLQWSDEALQQGFNNYRAVLVLNDGTEIISNTSGIFSRGKQHTLVFPNPARVESVITIITEGDQRADFQLFNSLGQLRLEQKITEIYAEISLENLSPGVYFYSVKNSADQLFTGNIIVY